MCRLRQLSRLWREAIYDLLQQQRTCMRLIWQTRRKDALLVCVPAREEPPVSLKREGEGETDSATKGIYIISQRTRGLSGECQTFVRDDGALGEKTLLGCREYDVEWDLTVSLKTATDQFSKTSTTMPTSSLSPDTLSILAPSILTPLVSSTATTTPTSSTSSGDSTNPQTGAIIGGVLGSLAILAVAGCVAVWLVVRRRRASASTRRSDGHVSPSSGHELPGDQPCVPLKEGNEEQGNYTDLSPASTSGDVYQARDAVGSSTKPAELG
ncbi:hypothetical protein CSHISOI_00373 [Colletotrichum shisoi]|uniref:Uncharacterized protein n=1 Tax=Colletotrichum shisoi TaxID=2078593 RepID=A0A5Q4CAX9_9PEZI|nr:hypothetical protein CSHISOI_00373 [Colletotrichum shisoi]